MKTILLIIGGMSDINEEGSAHMEGSIPMLQTLAFESACGNYRAVEKGTELTELNALLSLLGQNPHKFSSMRGDFASLEEKFEAIGSGRLSLQDAQLPGIVLPGFSGYGSIVTTSDLARGIGALASLDIAEFEHDPDDPEHTAIQMAQTAIRRSIEDELTILYTDMPKLAALAGDAPAKRHSLNLIDRRIISPIMRHVKESDEVMNLAFTPGYATSWRSRSLENVEIPALVYFNDRPEPENFNATNENTLELPYPYSLTAQLLVDSWKSGL